MESLTNSFRIKKEIARRGASPFENTEPLPFREGAGDGLVD
jgi:hypothetical protein